MVAAVVAAAVPPKTQTTTSNENKTPNEKMKRDLVVLILRPAIGFHHWQGRLPRVCWISLLPSFVEIFRRSCSTNRSPDYLR